jgi:acetoin utilization deacetylase AcuC-like enzyme
MRSSSTTVHMHVSARGRRQATEVALAGAQDGSRSLHRLVHLGQTVAQRSASASAGKLPTLLLHSAACQLHTPSPAGSHPENAGRTTAALDALLGATAGRVDVAWVEASAVPAEALARAHTPAHLARLGSAFAAIRLFEGLPPISAAAPTFGVDGIDLSGDDTVNRAPVFQFDSDTIAGPGTEAAVHHAAGAVIEGVDAVLGGRAANAFAVVRPPGHHCEADRAMGFCFVNNVAVGALHALAVHPTVVRRAAIVDFDVHHGNGTADIATNRAAARSAEGLQLDLLYVSTHQHPLYPMTGGPGENPFPGRQAAKGSAALAAVCNVELSAGAGSEEWRAAYESHVLPALAAFAPDLVLLSAGFDGHAKDPLASLQLDAEDFAYATRALKAVAPWGRVVSVLEGGYDIAALRECVVAHALALAE